MLLAAPALLGFDLVTPDCRVRIVETEAYRTPDDPGCHAHRGETPRNRVLFDRPGLIYMYFTYGAHWMLNIVAHRHGDAAAVLIRAARPIEGIDAIRARRQAIKNDRLLLAGPGRLAAGLGLDSTQYGLDAFDVASPLRLEPGEPVRDVVIGKRIGLAAGKGDQLPWRYLDANALDWCSRPLP